MKRVARICLAAVLSVLLLSAVEAQAGPVTLAWDANSEPNVTGYLVSYGNAPGQTIGSANVGLQTTWTFTAGVAGRTYYFRVQAYTSDGQTSAPSSEVSTTIANPPPPVGPNPFGLVDTPADNTTGVTGSLAMTGWALDDILVTRVRIFREAIAGEAAGTLVYIGDASFVPGARPDVAAAYPGLPASARAGWGYLMLTNFLPNRGNGTFTLRAYADDAHGHSTLLGSRRITCTNDTATAPFGAIDTPAQGQTVSGSINVFGWVLARGTRRADPPGGGTVQVVIDGVPVGSPFGWTSRPDLTALFPVAQYSGIGTALGVFTFNTNTLANGIHTIAWSVIDNQGAGAGIGSRFFTVANGASSTLEQSVSASAVSMGTAPMSMSPMSRTSVLGRRGFDFDAPFRTYRYDKEGLAVVQAEELDRIELLTGASEGFLVTPSGLQPLPSGARLDSSGTFTWQPGLAFVGTYDFVFVGADGARRVRIVLNPKGSGRIGPQVVIDTPSAAAADLSRTFIVAGWAADLDDDMATGIDTIHVWAYPVTGAAPTFVGVAALGGARPDVAAVYGDRFHKSGYGITVAGLAPGDYDVAVFAWSTIKQGFIPAKTVRVTVR